MFCQCLMYALFILEEKTRGTQDIKKAKSQELYHMSLAIVMGAARVSVSIILAVDHSALDSFLDLMRRNGKKKNNLSNHCIKQPEGCLSNSNDFLT